VAGGIASLGKGRLVVVSAQGHSMLTRLSQGEERLGLLFGSALGTHCILLGRPCVRRSLQGVEAARRVLK
jgi:hypothetical protein